MPTRKPAPATVGKLKKYRIYIGIDAGVNTGFCAYEAPGKTIRNIETLPIHKAMKEIENWHKLERGDVFVRVEDARLRTWFGNAGKEKLQGAGSVKRDSKIWEDYLRDMGIPFEMVPPKNNRTKVDADYFRKITGYTGRTSKHSRDAAMLVYGF